MATLSKARVAEIIKNAPPGSTPTSIVAKLRARGHILEGYEDVQTRADKFMNLYRSTGATDEMAAKFTREQLEDDKTLMPDVVTGFAQNALSHAMGASELFQKGVTSVTNKMASGIAAPLERKIVGQERSGQLSDEEAAQLRGKVGDTFKGIQTAGAVERPADFAEFVRPKTERAKLGAAVEDIAEFVIPAGATLKAGKVLAGANWLQKAPTAVKWLASIAPSVATTGAITAEQEGEINDVVIRNMILDAALLGAGAAIKKGAGLLKRQPLSEQVAKIATGFDDARVPIGSADDVGTQIAKKGESVFDVGNKTPIMKTAKSAGLKTADVRTLAQLSPDERILAKPYLDAAKASTNLKFDVVSGKPIDKPLDIVAKKFTHVMSKFDNIRGSTGEKLGLVKDVMKAEPAINPSAQGFFSEFMDKLQKAGVTINKKGALNFAKAARLKRGVADRKLIVEMYNVLKRKSINPATFLDEMLGIQDVIKNNVAKNEIGGFAKSLLNTTAGKAKDLVKGSNTLLKEFDDLYGAIAKLQNQVLKKGGTATTGKEIVKGVELLRRSLGNASSESMQIFQKISDLSRKLGIKEGMNLAKEANVAAIIEDAYHITSMRGLGAGVKEGIAELTNVKRAATNRIFQKLATLFPPAEASDVVEHLILLDEKKLGIAGRLIEAISNAGGVKGYITKDTFIALIDSLLD